MTPLADRVRAATLDNGIAVHLIAGRQNPTVDLVGTIEGGMFLEDPASAGIASLCVSMLDRGTRRRTQADISDALESSGARLGHGLSREGLTVRGRCLTEDLDLLLEILGDTLAESTFPPVELELVKEDARAGLREAAFDTGGRAYERAAGLVLGFEHPYARESLGRVEVIDAVRRDDLEGYYRRAVAGARMRLVMIGDFDPEDGLSRLARSLGAVPAGSPGLPAREAADARPHPAADGAPLGPRLREHVEVADKGQLDVVLMRPGVARTDECFTAYALANFILGGSFVSRLNQRLRDREGLTYGVHSAIHSAIHPGVWSTHVGVHPQHLEQAVTGVLEEMQRFAEHGVDEEELELARLNLSGSFPIKLETNRAVAHALLEILRLGKGPEYIDTYLERLRAATREQVDAAARRLFERRDVVVVTAGSLAGGGSS